MVVNCRWSGYDLKMAGESRHTMRQCSHGEEALLGEGKGRVPPLKIRAEERRREGRWVGAGLL